MYFLFITTLLTSLNVFAQDPSTVTYGKPLCYGREYSTNHMKDHPKQTVKKMRIKFSRSRDEVGILMDVQAGILQTPLDPQSDFDIVKPYENTMYCASSSPTSLECGIDCDGGHATVQWDVKTVNDELILKNEGFVLYGGCGDEQEGDMIWLAPQLGGDDVFKLKALPAEYCQQ